jgi:hypothetical protein
MSTFAVTNDYDLIPAVNYLLSNLDTSAGNVVLPGNVLTVNTTTGVISQSGNATPFAYLYQYINLRYSNNAIGTAGFDTNSNNYSYFGVYNSVSSSPSSNPSAYQWFEVSPPFDSATSRTLYYSAIGGRQIVWTAASSPPSSNYVVTVANVAIDLDVVTTAAGTPGERGPIALAFVITTANPNTATPGQLTGWFSAPRDNINPPIGTGLTPVVGDTATFTYTGVDPVQSATLTYNGSIWIPVNGQIVDGNVILANTVAANSIIANSITSSQIAADSIFGNRIASDTVTANNIAANTITGSKIVISTITGNLIANTTITGTNIATDTITANNIAGNTITGSKILAGTITGNLIAGNTITGNLIAGNTITGNLIAGNTITGNLIAATTITGDKITAFTITGNKIVGNTITGNLIQTGTLTTNLFTANTINGNIISAGTITTDKLSANLVVSQDIQSTGATIGNFNSSGYWLQGNTGNARFGNTVSIGNNLTVGNNASIGGNLTISGLVSSSNLISNTVATTTIIPSSVTTTSAASYGNALIQSNASPGVSYLLAGPNILTTITNQQAIIFWEGGLQLTLFASGVSSVNGTLFLELVRYRTISLPSEITTLFSVQRGISTGGFSTQATVQLANRSLPTFVDTIANPDLYTYAWGARWIFSSTTGTITAARFDLITETSPPGSGFFLNTMVTLGTKR